MGSDYLVMLDACVLLPMPLSDTLLRMAETPRLYVPKWSDDILQEVTRNLVEKWNKTEEQAKRREDALRQHFPEALVLGYETPNSCHDKRCKRQARPGSRCDKRN